ncbi:MAG: hypothetical protein SWH61_11690 [Thermodesulfobacteriota bacterium]|nr:hypothetical protein [Thermodesulfobacteriota bacterium]
MDGPKSLAEYVDIIGGCTKPHSSYRTAASDKLSFCAYLESMDAVWFSEILRLARQLPPLRPSIRIVALIPARNEQHRIRACLTAISDDVKTSAAHDWCEVMILENGVSGELGKTKAAVEAWIEENQPRFRVYVISKEWTPAEQAPLAKARKILADVTVARALDADLMGPLYLLSEDADIERIECGRLGFVLHYLDAHPTVDAVRGFQDRTMSALRVNHLALLERRSWQMAELLMSAKAFWPERNPDANFFWNRVVTAGSNVFFSAQVYSEIGGYSTDIPVFEDMDIGQRISVLRGRWSGDRFIPHVSSIRRIPFREESNIGRILHALTSVTHVYRHDGSNFYAIDQFIKQQDAVDEHLATLAPFSRVLLANCHRFERVLIDLSDEIYRIFAQPTYARRTMRLIMHFLGFHCTDYHLKSNGRLAVMNWDGFAELAEGFSARRHVPSWYARHAPMRMTLQNPQG